MDVAETQKTEGDDSSDNDSTADDDDVKSDDEVVININMKDDNTKGNIHESKMQKPILIDDEPPLPAETKSMLEDNDDLSSTDSNDSFIQSFKNGSEFQKMPVNALQIPQIIQTPGQPLKAPLVQSSTDVEGEDYDQFVNDFETDPSNLSFLEWLNQYNLESFHDNLLVLGYDNVKMFDKCKESDLSEIAETLVQMGNHQSISINPIKFKLQSMVQDLVNARYQNKMIMTPFEAKVLDSFDAKIRNTNEITKDMRKAVNAIEREKENLTKQIDQKFEILQLMLLQRKDNLLGNLQHSMNKKKMILSGKIETFVKFEGSLNEYKSHCASILNEYNGAESINKRETQISDINNECNKKYAFTVEKTQIGVPEFQVKFDTNLLLQMISSVGDLQETVNNNLCIVPVFRAMSNNGKDNVVTVHWSLANNFIGIDRELVSKIFMEWIFVEDYDLNDEKEIDFEKNKEKTEEIVSEYLRNKYKANMKWSSRQLPTLSNCFSDSNKIYKNEINVRRRGIFLVRLKLVGNHKDNYVNSSINSMKVFAKTFVFHSDNWDNSTKHKEIKIGVFNKKSVSRSIAGTWHTCFGSVASQLNCVNKWILRIKKKDPNRKFVSTMFGIVKHSVNTANGCFAYAQSDGYGFYAANGSIFHSTQYGQKFLTDYSVSVGDIIEIIIDCYQSSLSFHIKPQNKEIKLEPKIAFYIDSKVEYKLAISMRGCDNVVLVDPNK